jgi:hypothetical protein
MVRSDRGPDAMAGVRAELTKIDPNLAAFSVRTLTGYVGDTMAYLRVAQFVYGGIGVFGLVLAANAAGISDWRNLCAARRAWRPETVSTSKCEGWGIPAHTSWRNC